MVIFHSYVKITRGVPENDDNFAAPNFHLDSGTEVMSLAEIPTFFITHKKSIQTENPLSTK